ncbi:TPA: hypothetical protein N0F65_003347 [Lagenidium giganteum]|uniref:Uncharacterized protein n=1 Tax=Lagenidium giganteum TaxID=4803 RepID=A0AAV2ZB43_9STRA|nr:TPA: hypothetical protein N0F65_003347 [Lagenidium giganteum]
MCTVDQNIKEFDPAGIEIPRPVIVSFVNDALNGKAGTHEISLHQKEHAYELKRALLLSVVYAPAYTFKVQPMDVQTEDILRGFVNDLQEELASTKRSMATLEKTVAAQAQTIETLKQTT